MKSFNISLLDFLSSLDQQKFFDKMTIFQFRDLAELIYYLNKYWDYINSDLLQTVVTKIGDQELSSRMEEYLAISSQVKNETTAKMFALQIRDHPQLQIVRSEAAFTDVLIRLDAKWNEYTLQDADRLRQSITSIFSLASYSVSFCNVCEGTVLIKIWLRSECVPVIIRCEKMPEFVHRDKVLEVVVGGIPMHFSRSRVAKVEVTSITLLTSFCKVYAMDDTIAEANNNSNIRDSLVPRRSLGNYRAPGNEATSENKLLTIHIIQ